MEDSRQTADDSGLERYRIKLTQKHGYFMLAATIALALGLFVLMLFADRMQRTQIPLNIPGVLALAVIPSAALIVYVYIKDNIEKEPLLLLILLFMCGGVSAIAAYYLESPVIQAIDDSLGYYSATGIFIRMAIWIPVVEESLKFLILYLVTWRHKAFNFLYDGLVYSVMVSLGFAAAENVRYIYQNGIATGIFRAFTVVAMHCMVAVYMGVFYGRAKDREGERNRTGMIRDLVKALLIPVAMHGTYDFTASMKGIIWIVIFFILIACYEVFGFMKVNEASRADERITEENAADERSGIL
ncbi:MAG: PrsW family intramembrane metalloprotease [Lachnospiraceae bacterium]|nr:PrsW family intramembrane metalloprotease [Lachnospiraceae bacterium]